VAESVDWRPARAVGSATPSLWRRSFGATSPVRQIVVS